MSFGLSLCPINTFRFIMWPMWAIYPFLLFLTVAIPALLYRQVAKASMIE